MADLDLAQQAVTRARELIADIDEQIRARGQATASEAAAVASACCALATTIYAQHHAEASVTLVELARADLAARSDVGVDAAGGDRG